MLKPELDSRAFQRAIDQLPKQLARAGMATLRETMERIKSRMQEPGAPPTYPLDWDSDRQRKKVMAMLREEDNIPYTRTDEYINGFTTDYTDASANLDNVTAGAGAIAGDPLTGWQSKLHQGRWNYLPLVIYEELQSLPVSLLNNLKIYVGQNA